MHIRDQRNSNNFHGYRSDHKDKVQRIPTNTPQKELHQIDLQETILLRIKRERGIHLATNYRPQVYNELITHHLTDTNEDDEPLRDGVRLDLVALELAAAGIYFRRIP